MIQNLLLRIDAPFFNLEDAPKALALAEERHGVVYTWKTTCRANWLERRLSIVDAAGLVVLPATLPDTIGMPDDPVE